MPIFLECQRCTACCRWPGQVRLNAEEISRIAAFLGVPETDFIQQFTRLRSDRRGLALQEKSGGACVFLEGNDCAIQPVKPEQCRDFPNLWNFPGAKDLCKAIPRDVTAAERVRRISEVTGRTEESVRERLGMLGAKQFAD